MNFFKLTPDGVVVLYDEIDLAPGKVKVKKGGGAAGHNGIRSIDHLVGNAFWRVRLGVGHPGDKRLVESYVLSNFDELDEPWLDPLLEAVAKEIGLMVKGDFNGFMSRVAFLTQPPKEGKK